MAGRVDIHSHVLPGIDDGAPDLDQSVAMLEAAAGAGTTTIAATPHLHSEFPNVHIDELASRCTQVRQAAVARGLEIELVSGAEVSLTWAVEASDEELRLASYGGRGTDMLVETPPIQVAPLNEFLYHLRLKGLRITLAHPERSRDFQQDPSRLEELIEQGILLQVNASSVLRSARSASDARFAQRLLRDGLAHAIASDGHRATSWRPVTELARAAEAAVDLVGEERARWLTEAVPAAIVAGEKLPEAPAVVSKPKLLNRVFGGRG